MRRPSSVGPSPGAKKIDTFSMHEDCIYHFPGISEQRGGPAIASRTKPKCRPILGTMLRRKRARSRRSEDPSSPTTTIISSSNSSTTAHVSMEVRRRRRRARCSSNPSVIFWLVAGIGFSSVYFVRTHAQDDDGSAATTTNNGESATTILNPVVSADFCRLSPSRKRRITVPKVSVLCDTPGAYYSGSTAYRNSPVCVAGDKLRLDVLGTFY